jgi:hypothetical protein
MQPLHPRFAREPDRQWRQPDGFGIGWIEPSAGIGLKIEPHAANA